LPDVDAQRLLALGISIGAHGLLLVVLIFLGVRAAGPLGKDRGAVAVNIVAAAPVQGTSRSTQPAAGFDRLEASAAGAEPSTNPQSAPKTSTLSEILGEDSATATAKGAAGRMGQASGGNGDFDRWARASYVGPGAGPEDKHCRDRTTEAAPLVRCPPYKGL
jgi:hypothetical protein